MAKYVLSLQVEDDLEGIYEYTLTTWGVDQFHIYRKAIEEALGAVAANPMLPGSKARDDLLEDVRLYRVEHHYIAYRIRRRRVEVEFSLSVATFTSNGLAVVRP